jgi:hypothetical protein
MELEGYRKATVDIDSKMIASDGQIKLPTVIFKPLPAIAAGTPPPALAQGQGPAPLSIQK